MTRVANPATNGVNAMKTNKPKNAPTLTLVAGSNDKPENRKLPPDPYGDFERGAARAKSVIALYEKLNPWLGDECLVSNIVRDLICLSARDPKLGNVDEECMFAIQTYLEFAAENMWEAGWYDDMEEAQKAAERMLYPDLKQ
jgi:hypothetical protein